jgi:glutamate-1-semialdehyde aminotransferase
MKIRVAATAMRSVRRGTGAVTAALRDAGGTPPVLDIAGASHGGTDGVDTEIASVAGTRGACPSPAPCRLTMSGRQAADSGP